MNGERMNICIFYLISVCKYDEKETFMSNAINYEAKITWWVGTLFADDLDDLWVASLENVKQNVVLIE